MNGSQKTAFRRTVAWKRFRVALLKARGLKCELCGRKKTARQIDVHHLTPAVYDVLEPSRFKLLCTSCHELVEGFVFVQNTMPNREKFMAWAGSFLPRKEID